MSDSAWRPLSPPRRPGPGPSLSPFHRLARHHAVTVGSDTLIALALAGSLFFSIEPDAARGSVALYLVLTVAPFAVVAPLIGPAIDRAVGGRRLVVVGSAAARAVVAVLMIRHINSYLLFPEAFTMLVLAKGYHVAKSALVPTLVSTDAELVESNSKLQLIAGAVGTAVAIPGLGLLQIGPGWVLGASAIGFAFSVFTALRIPPAVGAAAPADARERADLRGAGIILAASAMALLRGIVGFLTFLVAFDFRSSDTPSWWFGVVLAASAVGSMLGAVLAPLIRRRVGEEVIITATLALTLVAGSFSAYWGGRPAATVMAAAVGLGASAGKLAFDSIVQRDAPDANRGRSIARFETKFQLVWVVGAFIPVVVPIPFRLGLGVVAAVAGFAAFSYLAGQRTVRTTGAVRPRRKVQLPRRRRRPVAAFSHRKAATARRPLVRRAGQRGLGRTRTSPAQSSELAEPAEVAEPAAPADASQPADRPGAVQP